MKNNYLLVYESGRHGNGFLHLQLLPDEQEGCTIKTIHDSHGKDCIVRAVSNDFFACWQGENRQNFRLVAHDGSLVMDKDNFCEFRSQFSRDGKYYGATGENSLLLLALNPEEKTACIVKDEPDHPICSHIKFNKNSNFFIVSSGKDCALYSNNGEKLHSLGETKEDYGFKFAPDGYGVIVKSQQENHVFLADDVKKRLPVEQDIGFAEYFLLKNNTNDDCKQELKQRSGAWITKYIQSSNN